MASSLNITQIGSLAWAVFVSEEKQHSLVLISSSSIPEKCVRKKGQVLEGKGGRAREEFVYCFESLNHVKYQAV